MKTLKHFLEEYPDNPPSKGWDDNNNSMKVIANRLNDELYDLVDSMGDIKKKKQAEAFQILALMINKSRL